MFEKAAKGNGSVTTEIEGAIVRRVPMLFRMEGQRDEDLFPALSLEALRVAQGASTYLVRWAGAQGLESFGARTGIEQHPGRQLQHRHRRARAASTLYD